MDFPVRVDFGFSLENGGRIGVSLFFILSGYFMAKSLVVSQTGLRFYMSYLFKRYYRLWLPYFVSCILIFIWLQFVLLPSNRNVDVSELFLNLLFIYHPGIAYVDNAHWFIGDLFVLQLIIGSVLLIKKIKYRELTLAIVYIIVLFQCLFDSPILPGLSKELFEALFGYQLFMMVKQKNLMSIFLCILGYFFILSISIVYFIYVAIFTFLLYDFLKSICISPMHNTIIFLGDLSLYWYLVHQNIGYSIIYNFSNIIGNSSILLVISIIVTLIIACCACLICNKIKNSIVVIR